MLSWVIKVQSDRAPSSGNFRGVNGETSTDEKPWKLEKYVQAFCVLVLQNVHLCIYIYTHSYII